MMGADDVFAGSIPAIYQRCLVPMIFEPYARDMADRAARLGPTKILEIAVGTGVVTRALAARLGNAADITATDLNQPMLDIAASLQNGQDRVTFRQADALSLPFDEESFDLAVCQFGVMFFPDKLQSYREARRVLQPGGSYIFSVWDGLAGNEFVSTAQAALERHFAEDPPKFMERSPHGYHDTRAIENTVREAGFSKVSIETVEKMARADSALDAATGYCQGNPLRMEIEARAPGELQAVTEMVASALAERFGHGQIEGRIRAHIITLEK
ncbi:methyltransferase domain-containing protein [Neorhizobium lilium]|uniref:Methyltransferase domain-containing protein n=1 Tax=Neorhizobium lilium TaxID=2503024 RepID=A0A3S3RHI2_9HYPH|nr:methyltransferase domain-containing protein [Neorhizobium lilium]RWX76058.1 methyltransferase domain-containing protein [Neorhizobium lilium]